MSGAPICRTPDDAFAAGYTAPCGHGVTPTECPDCRLRPEEIARLVVLLGPGLRARRETAAPPRAA